MTFKEVLWNLHPHRWVHLLPLHQHALVTQELPAPTRTWWDFWIVVLSHAEQSKSPLSISISYLYHDKISIYGLPTINLLTYCTVHSWGIGNQHGTYLIFSWSNTPIIPWGWLPCLQITWLVMTVLGKTSIFSINTLLFHLLMSLSLLKPLLLNCTLSYCDCSCVFAIALLQKSTWLTSQAQLLISALRQTTSMNAFSGSNNVFQ